MLLNSDRYIIALPTFEQILGYSNFYDTETYDRISPYYRNAIGNINILPIKSDPTSKDGDNDGILDIDEKWNGIDDRYMNIDPLKEDTIESLYPELKKASNLNNRANPIYLEINKNNITIHVNAYFNEGYNKNVLQIKLYFLIISLEVLICRYSLYLLDLSQYYGQKKLKDYADFFSSSSSFC